jgi:galactokinase
VTHEERKAWLAAEFAQRFTAPPTLWARAPGRVDLMGSHTDYNQGLVLTMTIDRDTWAAARPRADHTVRVQSLNAPGESAFDLDNIERDGQAPWANYVRGVATVLQEAGHSLTGCDILIHTIVPVSSGLSSSAALEMAASFAFEQAGGFSLDPVERAKLGQRAENSFVGVNCGILDQYTSSVGRAGHALLLDCRTLESIAVPIAEGIQIVICDTGARRELAGSEYGLRRAQCEQAAAYFAQKERGVQTLRDVSSMTLSLYESELDPDVAKRARFIIEENTRVAEMAVALESGNRIAIRNLTMESFFGARDLYEIVVPEMEAMLTAMLRAWGVIGARQAGAGFGGCMVAFVEVGALEGFARRVSEDYAAMTGIEAKVYPVQAAAGAGPVNSD